MLQTSWTAFFGAVAAFEALVLAWWAQKLYQVWSRLFSFVMTVRLPWQARSEVEADVEVDAEVQPKRSRPRQAAINARNDMI